MRNFKLLALVMALVMAEGMASTTALSAPLRDWKDEPFSMQCTTNPLPVLHGQSGTVYMKKTGGNGNPVLFIIDEIVSSSGDPNEVDTTPRVGRVGFASHESIDDPSTSAWFWVFSNLEDGPERVVEVTIKVTLGNRKFATDVTCTVDVIHTDVLDSPSPPRPGPTDDMPPFVATPPVDAPVGELVPYKKVEPSPDQDRTYECDPALLRMADGEKGVIYLRASDGVGRPAAWRAERFEPEGEATGTLALVDYRTGKAEQIDMEHPGSRQEWLRFETGEYVARIDVLSSGGGAPDRVEKWDLFVSILEDYGDVDPSAVGDRLPVRVQEAKCRIEVQPTEVASAPAVVTPTPIPGDTDGGPTESEPDYDPDKPARTYSCAPPVPVIPHGGEGEIAVTASDGAMLPLYARFSGADGPEPWPGHLTDTRSGTFDPYDLEASEARNHPFSPDTGSNGEESGEWKAFVPIYSHKVDGPPRVEVWQVYLVIREGVWLLDQTGGGSRQVDLQCEVQVQHTEDAVAVVDVSEGEEQPTDTPAAAAEVASTPPPTRNSYAPSGQNDSFSTADRIELPATITGRTSPTNSPSFFTFTAAGEGQRTVQASWNAPGGDNCSVSFFGPDGRFLQRGRGAGGAFGVQELAGQFYAAIQCPGVREYELNLDAGGP